MKQIRNLRFFIPGAAIAALLAALWSGLVHIGWPWPRLYAPLPAAHGPLMVCGFLGTLICIERAVALNRGWAFAAPALIAGGTLLMLAGGQTLAAALLVAGSAVLVAIFVTLYRFQPALPAATMAAGASAWLVGNGLWLAGRSIPHVALWWIAFLVLTVAGERLELSRMLHLARRHLVVFCISSGLLLAGGLLALVAFDLGARLSGLGLLGLSIWLARYDIARRTIRRSGLTRFIAACMLAGYAWLGVGGLLGMAYGGVVGGPYYDAVLHAIFVGFVFSMIFGHAPIIVPAVLRIRMNYAAAFYVHLGLLHMSLGLRVAGDLAGQPGTRKLGGLLNAVAILLFLGSCAWAAHRAAGPRDRRPERRVAGSPIHPGMH